MRIIFMGTPEFAVPALDILIQNNYDVVGVVTATDKLGGRGGKQSLESAVKKYAKAHNLNILQPEKLKDTDFLQALKSLKADLQIVVAFRMLPEIVWNMPPLGTINVHGSLLPKYRGAAPINWAIINGETETGVTTFFLKHEIDTGDVLWREKTPIAADETFGELYERMKYLGARALLKSLQLIENGSHLPMPQDDAEATKAPKIFHETCEINFEQTTQQVHNFVRGLSPQPTAWFLFRGEEMKVFKTKMEIIAHQASAGECVTDQKKYLKIATLDGFIHLEEVQLQGKKRLVCRDFLNGYRF